MATHKSAEKRSRQAERRRNRNVAIKSKVRTYIKKVVSALENKDNEAASGFLADAIPQIAKAASKGVLHRRNASRKISRLTKKMNNLTAEA
ncbi:MAG: 30S ribosomal protein S20 [Syntrophales bacterium]|nr:30S ribosomal protein S20 [Syntrophales bacterium]NLN59141.1 30S ribosomal protein S20 [Deltaproteobacteria bacterium]